MTIEWLAGNRIRGTSAERTTPSGLVNNVGGWVELGRYTSSGAVDTLPVTGLADKRYLMFLMHNKAGSGTVLTGIRLNADTGNNYSNRESGNGGADSTGTSQSYMVCSVNTTNPQSFDVGYITNYATKEKLMICHDSFQNTAGAGTAPRRVESVGKWNNTSNAISTVTGQNLGSGDFGTGSEIVVLGWDPADTHASNFWQELASVTQPSDAGFIDSGTFTAKKYLWIQCYFKGTTSAGSNNWLEFNGDTSASYASRNSSNSGADVTLTSRTDGAYVAHLQAGEFADSRFFNIFIVNDSASEKLVISHGMSKHGTGAGTAPQRTEGVSKWVNTSSQITSLKFHIGGTNQAKQDSILRIWGAN